MAASEFELIKKYFADISPMQTNVVLGVGDDAALINVDADCELVMSIDTQQQGSHFPENANACDIAQRAFRAAVSDIAAMGASPLCFTLALSLPEANEAWLADFSQGLKAAAKEFHCPLVGGDTTKGPLSITLQVQGSVKKNTAIKRKGAKPGDVIFVSGYLGGAAAYVALMEENKLGHKETAHAEQIFREDYFRPTPTIVLGEAIKQYANSAIDISDGLLADLQHICDASGINAKLDANKLPMRPELSDLFTEQALSLALTGGDDYQLCFTVPEQSAREVIKLGEDMECVLTVIGTMTESSEGGTTVACLLEDGTVLDTSTLANTGYSHF